MATLDQLPAEQRAIVELVVQRGRTYDALADVLQVPVERVRELARDALVELSPRTASRVDPDWRGQVADYLLGQQSNDAGRTTRDYLKRTESARAWALSLLDSLDPLYADGTQPVVPEPGGEPLGATKAAEPAADVVEPEVAKEEEKPAAAAETAEDRIRARERARKRRAEAEEKEDEAAEEEDEPARKREPARKPGALSPEAQSALKRRRLIGGGVAAVLLVVLVLALAGVFSGSDNGGGSSGGTNTTASTTPTGTSTTAGQPVQVLGQIALTPINKANAQGVAYVVQQGQQRFLVVQAKVPPLPNTQKVAAYEVWLYNSNSDARSLGAQYTNAQGVLQGRAPLPTDFAKFKAVDVSRELFSDKNTAHGTNSVLRGTFASLKPVPQQQQGGTTTTPTP